MTHRYAGSWLIPIRKVVVGSMGFPMRDAMGNGFGREVSLESDYNTTEPQWRVRRVKLKLTPHRNAMHRS